MRWTKRTGVFEFGRPFLATDPTYIYIYHLFTVLYIFSWHLGMEEGLESWGQGIGRHTLFFHQNPSCITIAFAPSIMLNMHL